MKTMISMQLYHLLFGIQFSSIFTHSGCGCENGPLKYPDGDFFDGDFSRFFPPEKN